MGLKFDYIGIVSANINDSIRFYRVLGVEFPDLPHGEDHVEVTLPNGLRLAFDALSLMKEIDPSWVEPTGQRLGLGFQCDSPSEVDAAYERVIAEGFRGKTAPWDAFWGQRYAIVLDPDGNEISLFAWN